MKLTSKQCRGKKSIFQIRISNSKNLYTFEIDFFYFMNKTHFRTLKSRKFLSTSNSLSKMYVIDFQQTNPLTSCESLSRADYSKVSYFVLPNCICFFFIRAPNVYQLSWLTKSMRRKGMRKSTCESSK